MQRAAGPDGHIPRLGNVGRLSELASQSRRGECLELLREMKVCATTGSCGNTLWDGTNALKLAHNALAYSKGLSEAAGPHEHLAFLAPSKSPHAPYMLPTSVPGPQQDKVWASSSAEAVYEAGTTVQPQPPALSASPGYFILIVNKGYKIQPGTKEPAVAAGLPAYVQGGFKVDQYKLVFLASQPGTGHAPPWPLFSAASKQPAWCNDMQPALQQAYDKGCTLYEWQVSLWHLKRPDPRKSHGKRRAEQLSESSHVQPSHVQPGQSCSLQQQHDSHAAGLSPGTAAATAVTAAAPATAAAATSGAAAAAAPAAAGALAATNTSGAVSAALATAAAAAERVTAAASDGAPTSLMTPAPAAVGATTAAPAVDLAVQPVPADRTVTEALPRPWYFSAKGKIVDFIRMGQVNELAMCLDMLHPSLLWDTHDCYQRNILSLICSQVSNRTNWEGNIVLFNKLTQYPHTLPGRQSLLQDLVLGRNNHGCNPLYQLAFSAGKACNPDARQLQLLKSYAAALRCCPLAIRWEALLNDTHSDSGWLPCHIAAKQGNETACMYIIQLMWDTLTEAAVLHNNGSLEDSLRIAIMQLLHYTKPPLKRKWYPVQAEQLLDHAVYEFLLRQIPTASMLPVHRGQAYMQCTVRPGSAEVAEDDIIHLAFAPQQGDLDAELQAALEGLYNDTDAGPSQLASMGLQLPDLHAQLDQ